MLGRQFDDGIKLLFRVKKKHERQSVTHKHTSTHTHTHRNSGWPLTTCSRAGLRSDDIKPRRKTIAKWFPKKYSQCISVSPHEHPLGFPFAFLWLLPATSHGEAVSVTIWKCVHIQCNVINMHNVSRYSQGKAGSWGIQPTRRREANAKVTPSQDTN